MEIINEKYRISNGKTVELPESISALVKKCYRKKKLQSYINKKKKETDKIVENLKVRITETLKDNENGTITVDGVPYVVSFGTSDPKYTITPTNVKKIENNDPELFKQLVDGGYTSFTDKKRSNFKVEIAKENKKKSKSKKE